MNYLTLLETTTGAGSNYTLFLLMPLLFGVMYFTMIRPQKKQQKKDQEVRESTQIGDEVTTIGGILGRVVTVKEDSLVIETGADRTKLKITRWAVQSNNTANEKIQAEREAAKAAKQAELEEKKSKKNK